MKYNGGADFGILEYDEGRTRERWRRDGSQLLCLT